MKALARLGVDNPVAVNLFAIALILGGGLFYFALPREIFPDFSTGKVSVRTLYPSATPQDVERLVTIHIENAADGLDGVKEIVSESQEGLSLVTIELEEGENVDRFLNDLRSEIDGIEELPEEVRTKYRPIVRELRSQFPVITLSVFGSVSEHRLRAAAERIRDDLLAIPGVVTVGVSGMRDPEVWIEVEPDALERHGFTPGDLAAIVGAKNLQSPIASMPTIAGDILLRLDGEVRASRELLDLPVHTTPDGRTLRLRDLGARVNDRFERARTLGRYNGRPALTFAVTKDTTGDAIDIAEEVRAYADQLRRGERQPLPEGLSIGVSSDFSIYIRNRLETMETSGIIGLSCVLIILCLFLDLRVALMTVLGLPIAVLGSVLACGFIGISMNMITMFSFIVVLGMLVDDAIVVVENVYRHMERGLAPREAALKGVGEVAWPVVATVSTTIAAFFPMMLLSGTMGKFIATIPKVVTLALLVSLLEALVILPAHLSEWSRGAVGARGRASGGFGGRWYDGLRRVYRRLLKGCLRWRYATLAAAAGGLAMIGAGATTFLKFELFSDFEAKVFFVDLETSATATLEQTQRQAMGFESRVLELPDEELASVTTTTGISFLDANKFQVGSNLAQITVELREGRERERSTPAVMESLREATAEERERVRRVRLRQPDAGPGGPAIEVAVRGARIEVLREVSQEVMAFLGEQRGIRDLVSDFSSGKLEVRVHLREEARRLGLTEAALASQMRDALEGREASRVRRGRDDVEILVRYPEIYQQRRETLRTFRVRLPTGAFVPLERVAVLEESRGLARVYRKERERAITITADVNKAEGNATEITNRLQRHFEDLGERYPGCSLELEGDKKEFEDSMSSLLPLMLFSLFVIFFILGALFRSYSQPAIVMSIIPPAVGCVVLGFLLTGENLSFLAVIGIVALCGVVVNDSLVLIDFANRTRRAGKGTFAAIMRAGQVRFRAILLTSMTTVAGLSPLAFFASGQARFLAPMARALVYGLASTTVLVLILIPCLLAVLGDLQSVYARIKRSIN